MRLIGCDLHASQQSIAMLDRDTGAVIEKTLKHDGEAFRDFYVSIPPPVVVGIEATGSMGWFLRLMEELAIECRVGHPVAIPKAEPRQEAVEFAVKYAQDPSRVDGMSGKAVHDTPAIQSLDHGLVIL